MAWSEYFPGATIWGIDINLARWTFGRTNPRIRCVEANAVALPLPPEIPEMLDIVIDDGSHEERDQLLALQLWGPRVRHYMVIEDVNLTKNLALDAAFKWTASKLGLQYELVDMRAPGGKEDDVLAIFTPLSKQNTHTINND